DLAHELERVLERHQQSECRCGCDDVAVKEFLVNRALGQPNDPDRNEALRYLDELIRSARQEINETWTTGGPPVMSDSSIVIPTQDDIIEFGFSSDLTALFESLDSQYFNGQLQLEGWIVGLTDDLRVSEKSDRPQAHAMTQYYYFYIVLNAR